MFIYCDCWWRWSWEAESWYRWEGAGEVEMREIWLLFIFLPDLPSYSYIWPYPQTAANTLYSFSSLTYSSDLNSNSNSNSKMRFRFYSIYCICRIGLKVTYGFCLLNYDKLSIIIIVIVLYLFACSFFIMLSRTWALWAAVYGCRC